MTQRTLIYIRAALVTACAVIALAEVFDIFATRKLLIVLLIFTAAAHLIDWPSDDDDDSETYIGKVDIKQPKPKYKGEVEVRGNSLTYPTSVPRFPSPITH